MKTSHSISLVACSMLMFATAFGQAKTEDHSAHHPPEKSGAPAPATAPSQSQSQSQSQSSAESKAPANMERMQANMKEMRELMSKIHGAKTPAERQTLLEKHGQAMAKQMEMMRNMGGGMMMGMSGKSGAGMGNKEAMMSDGKGMPCGDMAKCHQMMEGRMDMMQMMMEQMMQHQSAEHESHSGAK